MNFFTLFGVQITLFTSVSKLLSQLREFENWNYFNSTLN